MNKLFTVVAVSSLSLSIGCNPPPDQPKLWYLDLDSDGYGDMNDVNPISSVTNPGSAADVAPNTAYSTLNTDCDDGNNAVNPSADEVNTDYDTDYDCDGLPTGTPYAIGDYGPAGGIVFQTSSTGGFEAAPVDQDGGSGAEWGCYGVNIAGADGEKVGTGATNTADILNAACTSNDGGSLAADLIDSYSLNGISDWFLPSKDELNALYEVQNVAGNFTSDAYWSSTESTTSDNAWGQYWDNGSQSSGSKFSLLGVRAIRAFGFNDRKKRWYEDADNDGYGNASISMTDIYQPTGYVTNNTDCDDNDGNNYPGNSEVPDGMDNNCNDYFDEVTYAVGDIGPAGGVVFYFEKDNLFGLEAAPVDQANDAGGVEWGCYNIHVKGAEETAIGTGAQITAAIVAAGCTSDNGNPTAADLANSYSLNGYSDWYLPSKDELNALYKARASVDLTYKSRYWSASEYSAGLVWNKYWSEVGDDGSGESATIKTYPYNRVRAVRTIDDSLSVCKYESPCIWYQDADNDGYGYAGATLSATGLPNGYVADNTDCDNDNGNNYPGNKEITDGQDNDCNGLVDELFYVVGDIGPAGGVVFYVDETLEHGLEISPEDLNGGDPAEWGCYDINIEGAYGEALGTGSQNTAAIVAADCTSSDGGPTAAGLVSSYSLNGFTDWFLPSKGELNALKEVFNAVKDQGNFAGFSVYWSSTQYRYTGLAWESTGGATTKKALYYVRAIRAF